ncbi:UNKNOWN [Stylonychia lemnae]|uniref:Uncharacterized protein n=1 Tax=Stylonychia lemnae TaxID=5949 RepID=A0A078B927_STYLE|nr:UNKNOWN [Stylonychia lemnae]|eukprot:CDW90063.1 UNKNOWN [Stylonychia lemnae]
MTAVQETDFFRQLREKSLNNLQNKPSSWTVDVKYINQAIETLDRVKYDLEEGLILKLQLQRLQQIDEIIMKNCFQNKTYNYLHALKCEEFHLKNDYKLNILKTFFQDHIIKHTQDYQKCWSGKEFQQLKSNEDKDKAFLECHRQWTKNVRENVSNELEARVRELLQ